MYIYIVCNEQKTNNENGTVVDQTLPRRFSLFRRPPSQQAP